MIAVFAKTLHDNLFMRYLNCAESSYSGLVIAKVILCILDDMNMTCQANLREISMDQFDRCSVHQMLLKVNFQYLILQEGLSSL